MLRRSQEARGVNEQAPRGQVLPQGLEKKNRGPQRQDHAGGVDRHPGPKSAGAKIIEYPRKRPKMPGTIESQPSPRIPDSRAQEIRAYVAQLLATRQFASTGRRGQLLDYLVEHTLLGDADRISEYAIGLDVFQRPTSFDPRIESIVRTEVSRLRQRLKDYYAEEGRQDPIVIDFPPRSYAATFQFRDTAEIAEQPGLPRLVPAPVPVATRTSRMAIAWVLVAMTALAATAMLLYRHYRLGQPPPQSINAIVVLPFENYSPNHQDEYVADGMTEELTNDLAQWRDVRVVARTSAFAFKGKAEDVREIGRKLNVDAVLEGSFTEEGNRIRITAQLNRAADGYHLWSHAYEVESNDLLNVQSDVANAITAAIGQIRGGGSPPSIHVAMVNPEAHDLYLQAEYQYNLRTPDSLKKADQLFNAAIEKDPLFARAYLGIAYTGIAEDSLTTESQADTIPRARQAAEKALALDPNLGEAYGLLADVMYVWDRDWNQAEIEYRHALALVAGPEIRARYGWALATRGLFGEAHEQLRQAAEQDPLAITPPFDEFFAYNFERNVDGQKQVLKRMLQIRQDFLGAHALALVMEVEQHDCVEARQEAKWSEKTYPNVPVTQTMLAFAAACENNGPEALRRIKQMDAMKAPAYQIAIGYALLHDANDAIAQLNRAADQHEMQTFYLKYDPFFDEIRSDPRYISLEKRVGLL